jgi:predicted TIM-barrel fold metal-dependent hydrolase
MGLIIDTHKHINCQSDDKKYFPWQHTWYSCMVWAYGPTSPRQGRPPFERDPTALVAKQGARFADPDGSWTIADMDESGVDVSVLLPIDYDYVWGSDSGITIHEKHEHVAELQRQFPTRFIALAGPDPRRPGAVDTFVRGVRDLGLRGLKLIPKAGFYPWDERAYMLYDKCVELDVPVFVCTQPEGGGYDRIRFTDPIHLDDVVADYPDLKLVLLHAGAPLYDYFEHALLVASRAINASISLDMWLYGYDFLVPHFIPNFLSDEESVVRLVARARDVLGAHRIMWGSDTHSGPRIHGTNIFDKAMGFGIKTVVDFVRELPATAAQYGKAFSQDDVDLILGENASRILAFREYPEWQRPHTYGWRRLSPPPAKG